MSLVVNKNMGAMTAHRYLKLNESSFEKAVERLSSGMKINRAADDPAGLVISEKFRAQIDGLNQAISNARDGISLVQTAEGALDEVTTVLRSMRTKALHAANTGATDATAAAADQEQIGQAIQTLNRIANTTAFGTKKLLDGSAGVTATTTDSDVTFVSGTSSTVAGTYAVEVTTQSEAGKHASAAARTAIGGWTFTMDAGGVATGAGTIALSGNVTNGQAISVAYANGEAFGTTATNLQTALRAAFGGDTGITVTYTGGATNTMVVAGINRVGSTTAGTDYTLTVTGATGITAPAAATAGTINGSTKLARNEILTFKNGDGGSVRVSLLAGTTVNNAVSQMNTSLTAAGFKVTAAWDDTNKAFTVENQDYGDKTIVKNTITSNLIGTGSTGLAATAGQDAYISDGGGLAASANAGINVAGKINNVAATSSGGIYLTGASGTDVEGLKLKIANGAAVMAHGSVVVEQNSLTFQIGAFENQTVKIGLNDMRTNMLGSTATGTYTSQGLKDGVYIANLDVTTEAGAQDAIKVIDAALSEVSSQRSVMGAFQKDVLEASVRNLGVASENMSASESVIRDADMAQEMLSFSRAQILQSTSMSMLAQANQAPQSIMKLFG